MLHLLVALALAPVFYFIMSKYVVDSPNDLVGECVAALVGLLLAAIWPVSLPLFGLIGIMVGAKQYIQSRNNPRPADPGITMTNVQMYLKHRRENPL